MIYRLEGRDAEARTDFEAAAGLGSNFAKSVLVAMNPYSAMCNQMLKNVFSALEKGSSEVENPFATPDVKRG